MSAQTIDLFVFIDGLGWEIYRAHPWFLKDHAPYAKPVESILGYSNACIPSILCGRMPDEHLHWSSYYYSPLNSPFADIALAGRVPRILRSVGRINRLYLAYLKRSAGFDGYFDAYDIPRWKLKRLDYYEKQDLFQPQAYNGWDNVFAAWRRQGKAWLCLSDGDDDSKLHQLQREAATRRLPEKAYLHLNGLDGLLHQYPHASSPVANCLSAYQSKLDAVLGGLKSQGIPCRLKVFSDHGMCRVGATVDIARLLAGLDLDTPGDYFAFLDATMARFWFANDRAKEKVIDRLAGLADGRWLAVEERKAHGLDPEAVGFYGEEIFLLNPGAVIEPNDLSRKAPYGMHGYDPAHKDSFAVLLSSDQLSNEPMRITDIFQSDFV